MSKAPPSPPQLMLNASFDNIEALAEAGQWDTAFCQLDPGLLVAKVMIFGNKTTMFCEYEWNRSFHQVGNPPKDHLTFGFTHERGPAIRWSGMLAPPGTLFNFNTKAALNSVNPPGIFMGSVFSISPELLLKKATKLGCQDNVHEALENNMFWASESEPLLRLRALIRQLVATARKSGSDGLNKLQYEFDDLLPTLLINILQEPGDSLVRVTPKSRADALDRAIQVLYHHDDIPETVAELCEAANVSWSTLERAFSEEFSLTPRAYMKSRRLAGVRKELLLGKAAPPITEAANRWGFSHLGSFSADYRRQFGELPSATKSRTN